MERLSILINAKVEEGQWKGIRVARNLIPLHTCSLLMILFCLGKIRSTPAEPSWLLWMISALFLGKPLTLASPSYLFPKMFIEDMLEI